MNLNFYFGKGFGALFLNPINNSHVLFFHNFSLYYFYKLGVVGILFIILIFILIIFNVYKFFYNYFKLENIDKNIYISLFSSLLYPMILSATYKSISFGFILGLFLTLKYKHDDRKIFDKKICYLVYFLPMFLVAGPAIPDIIISILSILFIIYCVVS